MGLWGDNPCTWYLALYGASSIEIINKKKAQTLIKKRAGNPAGKYIGLYPIGSS